MADYENIEIPNEPPDEDEMKSQSNFDGKISELTDKIHTMKKVIPSPNDVWDSVIKPKLMTDRQIAKKIMMTTTGIIPGIAGQPSVPKVDSKSAHLSIYGKLMFDSNGKLVDDEVNHPECVNWILFKKNTSSINQDNDTYPMKNEVKNIKLEVRNSIKGLPIKMTDLKDGLTKAAIEIGIGVAAFIDALTNIPKPQPSLAISALLGIFSSIAKLQSMVLEIVPLLSPLQYLSLIVPKASPIIEIISTAIILPISIVVDGIAALSSIMSPITALIPSSKEAADKLVQDTNNPVSGTSGTSGTGTSGIGTSGNEIRTLIEINSIGNENIIEGGGSTTGTIKGTVKSLSGIPIVSTVIVNSVFVVYTKSDGKYQFDRLSAGKIKLDISAGGNWKSKTVESNIEIGKVTVLDVVLESNSGGGDDHEGGPGHPV